MRSIAEAAAPAHARIPPNRGKTARAKAHPATPHRLRPHTPNTPLPAEYNAIPASPLPRFCPKQTKPARPASPAGTISGFNNTVSFLHISPLANPESCARNPSACSRHGLQYTYGKDGRLQQIQIYDRSIILKGENSYTFLANGTANVYDHKSNNDTANFNKIDNIPASEALRRLTTQPLQLAAQAAQLPAGCLRVASLPEPAFWRNLLCLLSLCGSLPF
ncbi:hypothetical protein A7P95_02520 [Eikenella longinqua]|uniref:Uncharacterized protein n=1 Tax=Eikenella longinqua TaxID=1795827 RepID=A0A1A9S2J4_9NEIS|nr:hypothetical protein [Eikenella longinqua]OAM30891.1 hypothetical protein A7P95_02520 [Eikenella longinqua]